MIGRSELRDDETTLPLCTVSDNAILITHQRIGQKHATLTATWSAETATVTFVELGSMHGSMYNGRQLEQDECVVISEQDELILGNKDVKLAISVDVTRVRTPTTALATSTTTMTATTPTTASATTVSPAFFRIPK